MNENEGKEITRKTSSDKWEYVVCFGTVITFIAGIGHVSSFGLIYNNFIKCTNSTAKSLTTAHGVFAIMLAVGGIISNMIVKKLSLRKAGLVGSIAMILGSMTTILISNTNQLSFTFGTLQGIGFGMMVPVCYSTLNLYFVEKRTTVLSFCKAIQGVLLIWYPHLMKLVLSVYGFRGTLLIVGGISLHTIPGMLCMQPMLELQRKRTANDIKYRKNEDDDKSLLKNKQGINDNHSDVENGIRDKRKNNKTGFLLQLLNIHVLKDSSYCNICFGQSFVNFSDLNFFILQPMLLFQIGFTATQVATCISICAGFDVAGRFLLGVISSLVTVNTRVLFYIATFFTLIFRIAIIQLREFVWVAVLTGVLGTLRAWLHVASPLVIASHVSHQDFPGAYAMFMMCAGLVNVFLAPGIGLLKDFYEDYVPAFYALSLCCLPCLILWPIEYVVRK